jgi:hypothetical protein
VPRRPLPPQESRRTSPSSKTCSGGGADDGDGGGGAGASKDRPGRARLRARGSMGSAAGPRSPSSSSGSLRGRAGAASRPAGDAVSSMAAGWRASAPTAGLGTLGPAAPGLVEPPLSRARASAVWKGARNLPWFWGFVGFTGTGTGTAVEARWARVTGARRPGARPVARFLPRTLELIPMEGVPARYPDRPPH